MTSKAPAGNPNPDLSGEVGALERALAKEVNRREHAEQMLARPIEDWLTAMALEGAGAPQMYGAIEMMSDGVAFTDGEGLFTYMNPAHLKLFGFDTQAQVIGRPWSILYDADQLDWIAHRVTPELSAVGSWRGDLVGRAIDRRPVYQEVSLTRTPQGLICATRDIAVRLQLEEERTRLQIIIDDVKARRDAAVFGVEIAHDLSNIVAAIRINAEILGNEGVSANIVRATERANEIIAQLSASGRREGASPEPFDISQLLNEVCDLGRLAVHTKAKLHLEIEPALQGLSVRLDRPLLHRVILNLIKNAAEAAPNEDAIEVTLTASRPMDRFQSGYVAKFGHESEGKHVWLCVNDSGIGMTRAALERLATPYNSTKELIDGAPRGLGVLALVAFVQLHASFAQVLSRYRVGTSVYIQIPVPTSSRR